MPVALTVTVFFVVVFVIVKVDRMLATVFVLSVVVLIDVTVTVMRFGVVETLEALGEALLDACEEVDLDDEDGINLVDDDVDARPVVVLLDEELELNNLLELAELVLKEDFDAVDDEEVLVGIAQEILAPIPTNTSLGSVHLTQFGEPPTPQPPY